jgi:hypothetical protein
MHSPIGQLLDQWDNCGIEKMGFIDGDGPNAGLQTCVDVASARHGVCADAAPGVGADRATTIPIVDGVLEHLKGCLWQPGNPIEEFRCLSAEHASEDERKLTRMCGPRRRGKGGLRRFLHTNALCTVGGGLQRPVEEGDSVLR